MSPLERRLKAVAYSCESGVAVDAIEKYVTGDSGLQNFGDGTYQYNFNNTQGLGWFLPHTGHGAR